MNKKNGRKLLVTTHVLLSFVLRLDIMSNLPIATFSRPKLYSTCNKIAVQTLKKLLKLKKGSNDWFLTPPFLLAEAFVSLFHITVLTVAQQITLNIKLERSNAIYAKRLLSHYTEQNYMNARDLFGAQLSFITRARLSLQNAGKMT